MKMKFFYIFLFLFFFHFFIPTASAQLSKAVCTISVSVDGNSVTVIGSVTESRPGLDPSETFMDLSDEAGGPGKVVTGGDSVTDGYSFTALSGNYIAEIQGQSWSNPGGGTSTCNDFEPFTVGSPQWILNVNRDGSGSGYVYSSNVGGIDCGGDCSQYYDEGTGVTLEASPSSGSNFTGWGGECSGTGSCTFQMNGNRYVVAYFETAQPPPGNFNVTTSYCFGWPNPMIEVNLNPSSGADYYALQKWNGSSYQTIYTGSYQEVDSYGDTNISMYNTYWYRVVAYNSYGSTISNNEINHYPTPEGCGQVLYTVTATIGTPSGSISGDVTCPGSCQATVEANDSVTLFATPANGYAFSHWTGACSGFTTSTCTLVVTGNMSTSAHFGPNNYLLQVNKAGTGSGTVTSINYGGISCGSDCSENYDYNNVVRLQRAESLGSDFAGWGGACSGTGLTCDVTMNAAKNVTATFSANLYSISVASSPSGSGTIIGTTPSAGTIINCGGDCSENLTYNTPVTLNATGANGYSFSSWSGACLNQGQTCNLTMDASKSTTANFVANFNYSLSNSGTSNVIKSSGNEATQNTITKTLTAGATQSVDLTVSGTPPGVSYNISNRTCAPTCSSTITFTVGPTTPVGTHPITVTGSLLGKTTNFNLVVTGAPISVACSGSPATVFLNQTVNWTANVSGGRAPLTYAWIGTAIPTSPAPNTASYNKSYSTIGQKTAQLRVTDADGTVSTCPAATVMVNFDPNFKEF